MNMNNQFKIFKLKISIDEIFQIFFLFLKKFTIDVAIIHDHEDRESFVIQDMSSNYRILKSRCKLEDGG